MRATGCKPGAPSSRAPHGSFPDILAAFNPFYGLSYLHHADLFDTLLILGALMLVVTGGEAMYAAQFDYGRSQTPQGSVHP